jgi:tetratricopeptide (TPR) repeat protein
MKNPYLCPMRYVLIALVCALTAFWACKNDPKPKPMTSAPAPVDPAIALLTQQIEANPNNDSLLFRRAEAYWQAEGYDEALLDLSAAFKIDSMQPAYYHLMADVLMDYARPNDSRRAIDVLKAALLKFPDRTSTLLKLSELQLIVRQHGDALASVERILVRDPQNADAFFMTGRVALDMKDTIRAIASLQKSVQLDAQNIDGWIFLGRIFSNKNNPQALRFFDNALRIDSLNMEAREFKAIYYKRRGEFDKAFAMYRSIVAQEPDYSTAWFDMGMIYLEQDNLDKAIEHFSIAIKTDPIFINAYYYRGMAYELKENFEAALQDYQKANRMSPNFEAAKTAVERLTKK